MNDELPDLEETVIERIDMKSLTPLFDANHTHHYVLDPDDVTDTYQAEMCDIKGCGMGRLVTK